jgi:hypothetical protein
MFQVRFHGRGGQGVVTAAELLAEAAFREGRHAQAFPSFGSEQMGAPVMSFCRIAGQPIIKLADGQYAVDYDYCKGMRPVRRRMPLRRHRDGARANLERPDLRHGS